MTNAPVSGEWAHSFDAPVSDPNKPAAAQLQPQRKLSVVLPFTESDYEGVIRLLNVSWNLSKKALANEIFLMPFKNFLRGPVDTEAALRTAACAFMSVRMIQDAEGVTSDWQRPWQRDGQIHDASGPNSMFRQAAWFFYTKPELGPWLYLEPDCAPLTPDWLEQLETEYRNCGKPFMGVKMTGPSGQEYLNGVGIYPAKAAQIAASLVMRTTWPPPNDSMEVAFDMAGSREVLPKAHITQKIQLSLSGRDDLPALHLRPGVVLYHGSNAHEISRRHVAQGEPANGGAVGSMPPETPARNSVYAAPFIGTVDATSVGDRIRQHCDALVQIASEHSSGRKRILTELRRRKLAPKVKRCG